MRRAALVGTVVSAIILAMSLFVAPLSATSGSYGPAFQDATATATAMDETATAGTGTMAETATAGMADADETATAGMTTGGTMGGATATAGETATVTALGALPQAGESGPNMLVILLGAAALLILGIALVATRRGARDEA